MDIASSQATQSVPTYVVYDAVSGRIVGHFRSQDAGTEQYETRDADEVLAYFRDDETVLAHVTGGNPDNLAVMATQAPHAADFGALRVLPEREALAPLPRLRLYAEREEMEGDGEDTVEIQIDVVDDAGHIQRDYAGEVHVTTSRGKLSARGGQVRVEKGRGSVTLTSVNETVDRVRVRAMDSQGLALPDRLELSFV